MSVQGPELRSLANEHWRAAYRKLIQSVGGEWRSFGAVDAFASPGLPVAFANGCLVLEPATADDLTVATEWVRDFDLPFRVRIETIAGEDLITVPPTLGLVRDEWPMPGMVLRPIPGAPQPSPGVEVSRVDAKKHSDFIRVLDESGLPQAVSLKAFAVTLLDDPDMAMFVCYLDGRPVGSSVAYLTEQAGGVYVVGTVEAARRRGVGSAATWAAVDHIRKSGHDAAVLQSSPMGFPVYKRMGFRAVVEYAVFTPIDND